MEARGRLKFHRCCGGADGSCRAAIAGEVPADLRVRTVRTDAGRSGAFSFEEKEMERDGEKEGGRKGPETKRTGCRARERQKVV